MTREINQLRLLILRSYEKFELRGTYTHCDLKQGTWPEYPKLINELQSNLRYPNLHDMGTSLNRAPIFVSIYNESARILKI